MKTPQFLMIPFTCELHVFLATWIGASFTDVYYWCKFGDPIFAIHLGIIGFILTYLLIFTLSFFRGRIKHVLKAALTILCVFNIIIDTLCYNIYHSSFVMDIVAICMGSNLDESKSFIGMYLNSSIVGFVLIAISIMTLVCLITKKTRRPEFIHKILFTVLILFVAKLCFLPSKHYGGGVFIDKFRLLCSYKSSEDLTQYRTTPRVSINGEQPEKIILILGESMSKTHCSFYGYSRNTMPKIDSMIKNSEIIPYHNVTAAWHTTVDAIERIMTSYSSNVSDKKWYECTYLQDIMKSANYKTYWISNQSSAGLADNIVCKIASLSDSVIWVGQSLSGAFKKDYDELLIPIFFNITKKREKQFVIVHMMGQHEDFEERYPKNHAKFPPTDINDWRTHWISHYDNAISYSDSILHTMFKGLENENAVAIFFPDHGLDVFKTDKNYAGHARPSVKGSIEECLSIPLFFYFSPKYRTSHEYITEIVTKNSRKPYNTENTIYTICDFAQIKVITPMERGESILDSSN